VSGFVTKCGPPIHLPICLSPAYLSIYLSIHS